jgi:glycosyltransferase involved in cell wall biosynthesis
VEFVGFQPAAVVRQYLGNAKAFIFPSEEDFGIVPVEAQACGTPVLAYGRGGALETVVPLGAPDRAPTGSFFQEQTAQAIENAVRQFESNSSGYDADAISRHAQSFSIDAFKTAFGQVVNDALDEFAPPWVCPRSSELA